MGNETGKMVVVFGLMLLGALGWGIKVGLLLGLLEVGYEYFYEKETFDKLTVWGWVKDYFLFFWGALAFVGALCVNVLMLFLMGKFSK